MTKYKLKTELLKISIQKAIYELLSLFAVSEEEFEKWQRPKIRRQLMKGEYPEHDIYCPAYSFLENFLYFPQNGGSKFTFTVETIRHEVSHYIHRWLNISIIYGIYQHAREGKRPKGHHELTEAVASYPNFILGMNPDYMPLTDIRQRTLYNTHGPTFLPRLARMTVEEFLEDKSISLIYVRKP